MVARRIGKKLVNYNTQKQGKIVPLKGHNYVNDVDRMSVSKMQLFEKCPYAFQFYYLDELKFLDDNERMAIGKEIHDIFYYASQYANPEEIRNLEGYEKHNEACEAFINYSRKRLLMNGKSIPEYVEYEIHDKDHNVLLYIDRIDKVEGGLEITDYKTGKFHYISCYRFQLAFYAYFVEKHLKQKVVRWSIFFSKDGKTVSELVDRRKIDLIPTIIKIVRERIQEAKCTGDFYKRSTIMCNFCGFKHFGLCSEKGDKTNNPFGILDLFKEKRVT